MTNSLEQALSEAKEAVQRLEKEFRDAARIETQEAIKKAWGIEGRQLCHGDILLDKDRTYPVRVRGFILRKNAPMTVRVTPDIFPGYAAGAEYEITLEEALRFRRAYVNVDSWYTYGD